MRARVFLTFVAVGSLFVVACAGESEEDRQARELQAEKEAVMTAEAQYDATVFDTLTWESPEKRLERGGVVWRASCQKCHGANGDGRGEMAVQSNLTVPTFLVVDWPYAGDLAAIRHRIYVGHEGAMPNWGLHGLKYRDIDAAAGYIIETMAPAREAAQD